MAHAIKKRIAYIDIAKAFAIIAIIVYHSGLEFSIDAGVGGVPGFITRIACSFHLIVFFVASGYFFKSSTRFSVAYFKKEFKSLIVPYIVSSILIISAVTINAATNPNLSGFQAFIDRSLAAFYGSGVRNLPFLFDVQHIGGIWFLLALFWARFILTLTNGVTEWKRALIIFACAVVGAWSSHLLFLPWDIQIGAFCSLLLYVGRLARKYSVFERGRLSMLIVIPCAIVWAVYLLNGGGTYGIVECRFPFGPIDVICGLASAYCVFMFAWLVERFVPAFTRFFSWIGRNTLPIFCAHILEDWIVVWFDVGGSLSFSFGPVAWFVLLAQRFVLIAGICLAMFLIPGIRKVYYPKSLPLSNITKIHQ